MKPIVIDVDEKTAKRFNYISLAILGATFLNFCVEFGGHYVNGRRNDRLLRNHTADYSNRKEAEADLEIEKRKLGLENVDIYLFFEDIPSAGTVRRGNYHVIAEGEGFRNRATTKHELYHISVTEKYGRLWRSFPLTIGLRQLEEWLATSYAISEE